MVSIEHAHSLVESLSSSDPLLRRIAAKEIKNYVIGSRTNKELFVEAAVIPPLINALATQDSESDLPIQAAAALGSIACGYEKGMNLAVKAGALRVLLNTLGSSNVNYVEGALRAIKVFYLYADANSKNDIFEDNHAVSPLDLLIKLTSSSKKGIAEIACIVLTKSCTSSEKQYILAQKGLLVRLKHHVNPASHRRNKESVLEALGVLTKGNKTVSTMAIGEGFMDSALRLTRDPAPSVRLLACKFLANLIRAECIDVGEVESVIIPTIVKLFSEKDKVGIEAPEVLTYLIDESESSQKLACEADAIKKLASVLCKNVASSDGPVPEITRSALFAIACLSSLLEDARKMVIEAKLLPIIVSALSDPSPSVRLAAASCVRSLSRSVKNIRTCLVDAGVAKPLFTLLDDSCYEVQTSASASICNIVLDFSPMKQTFLDLGGIRKLVKLTSSPQKSLKLNAIWALKNSLFMADFKVKKTVVEELTYETLRELICDSSAPDIQEQAITLLRNLAYSTAGVNTNKVEELLRKFEDLFEVLHSVLGSKCVSSNCVTQALYVVCNMASGSRKYKDELIDSAIMSDLLNLTSHMEENVRVASVWCIINLTWRYNNDTGNETSERQLPANEKRVRRLREMGFETRLKEMLHDSHSDVRDRVRSCLDHFKEYSSNGSTRYQGNTEEDNVVLSLV